MKTADVNLTQVRNYQISGATKLPTSISTRCGICGEKVIFTLHQHGAPPNGQKAFTFSGICPSCQETSYFSCFCAKEGNALQPAAITQYPITTVFYPQPYFPDNMPDPIKRSMTSAIDSFNNGNYTAAAVTGRRALEGMFKYLVPASDRGKALYALIEQVKSSPDFSENLTKLSHLVREGGNLGAHFDEDREPDQEMARQVVEMTDYLSAYLYTLPETIKALEQSIKGSNDGT